LLKQVVHVVVAGYKKGQLRSAINIGKLVDFCADLMTKHSATKTVIHGRVVTNDIYIKNKCHFFNAEWREELRNSHLFCAAFRGSTRRSLATITTLIAV
jgi:hypothetical protein